MWKIEEPLIFSLVNGGRLKIPKSSLEQFSLFVQREAHIPESGGVLLGRFIKGTNDILCPEWPIPQGWRKFKLVKYPKLFLKQLFSDLPFIPWSFKRKILGGGEHICLCKSKNF